MLEVTMSVNVRVRSPCILGVAVCPVCANATFCTVSVLPSRSTSIVVGQLSPLQLRYGILEFNIPLDTV